MSTAAIPQTTAPTRLVVTRVRPADPRNSESSEGTVVPLPERGERTKRQPRPNTPDAGSSVEPLNPEAAERAVVGAMSCKVAQAAVEVLSGVRSVQQLARWLDARCLSALTTRARLHAEAYKAQTRRQSQVPGAANVHTLRHQPLVHSVHCSAVSPGIFETCVVIADKTRFRAIAMRFELNRGLWKVTALQIG
ncbi:Rv3235 family protein [Arthrobacter sp. H35-D1]|uniref:Rv3235 family protein n=1 Tax=Arthrobacter sp. H35-D1 TaxID=3046202 RepID=UPI0024BB0201|nr:Rv3235 family protein [Arthrobacter sp. H35-D1]MDJ0315224.1 Rv3235 family protein [Arthrobacter sp. H35-D1]